MSNLEINNVLAQIGRLRNQIPSQTIQSNPPDSHVDFGALLKSSIDQVNATQLHADRLSDAFEKGTVPGLNLAEVMIASQKASVSFQATMQVRNKLVEAYKDIMNMPM